jgi:hypothetical protein
MTYLRVHDNISNIERTVTQKAYDIITKNKRNPRYKFLAYVDEAGQEISGDAPVLEKKTQASPSPEKSAAPVEGETATTNSSGTTTLPEPETHTGSQEGITVIRKKPGPKPKQNAKD